jgi:hypothetical protein
LGGSERDYIWGQQEIIYLVLKVLSHCPLVLLVEALLWSEWIVMYSVNLPVDHNCSTLNKVLIKWLILSTFESVIYSLKLKNCWDRLAHLLSGNIHIEPYEWR